MSGDLFRLFKILMCGTFIVSANAHAMEEESNDFKIEILGASSPSNKVKPFCDPLPREDQSVLNPLQTPVSSLMNLAPLYNQGLSGNKQIAAVIEGGFVHTPPGMAGVILNSIESYQNGEHASMVAQVVASRVRGIGIVPGAQIFMGGSHSTLNGDIAVTYTDAVKLAIRAGAKAINLSFKQFQNHWFLKKEGNKGADYDFTGAIEYALQCGIPVFTSGGNNREDLENTRHLKDIIKGASIYNDNLLVIAGGFGYPDEVFGRDDVVFAEESARVTGKSHLKKLMITAPYKVKVYQHESTEDRKKQLLAFRKRLDAEEFRDMWVKDLSTFLDATNLEEIKIEDINLIKDKLIVFNQDSAGLTNDAYKFFIEQSKRTDLPSSLRKELEKFGRNFIDLYIDLLTDDETKPSAISIEEHRKLAKESSQSYDPRKLNGILEEYILGDEEDKLVTDSFSIQTVHGTSFSSPALMSVFLLLNEFSEREGSLLDAEDILNCMRGTAWEKPYADTGEDLAWYGCGVVDGGKALQACQLLLGARRLSEEKSFDKSLESWKAFLKMVKGHAKSTYILEIANAFKSLETYQEASPATQKESILEEFYKEYLFFWPQLYENHSEERTKAFMLYEEGREEECFDLLIQMRDNNGDDTGNVGAEEALFSLLNKKRRPTYQSFHPANEKFNLWMESFTENDLTEHTSITGEKGTFFSKGRKKKTGLSMDIRNGLNLFTDLLNEVDKTWADYAKFNFENVFDRVDASMFLDTINDLQENLQQFIIPEKLCLKLEGHVARAKIEKEKKFKK